MIIGEDKNKIGNIVVPNLIHFRQLYSHVLHQYVVQKGSNLTVKVSTMKHSRTHKLLYFIDTFNNSRA